MYLHHTELLHACLTVNASILTAPTRWPGCLWTPLCQRAGGGRVNALNLLLGDGLAHAPQGLSPLLNIWGPARRPELSPSMHCMRTRHGALLLCVGRINPAATSDMESESENQEPSSFPLPPFCTDLMPSRANTFPFLGLCTAFAFHTRKKGEDMMLINSVSCVDIMSLDPVCLLMEGGRTPRGMPGSGQQSFVMPGWNICRSAADRSRTSPGWTWPTVSQYVLLRKAAGYPGCGREKHTILSPYPRQFDDDWGTLTICAYSDWSGLIHQANLVIDPTIIL